MPTCYSLTVTKYPDNEFIALVICWNVRYETVDGLASPGAGGTITTMPSLMLGCALKMKSDWVAPFHFTKSVLTQP